MSRYSNWWFHTKLSLFILNTYLPHPEWHFVNLVDGHERLHVIKQKNIVEDGCKQGQRAIKHCSREGVLPKA